MSTSYAHPARAVTRTQSPLWRDVFDALPIVILARAAREAWQSRQTAPAVAVRTAR